MLCLQAVSMSECVCGGCVFVSGRACEGVSEHLLAAICVASAAFSYLKLTARKVRESEESCRWDMGNVCMDTHI